MPSWDDYGRVSYAKPRSSMHGSTVVLISILTSAVTSVGAVYLTQRFDVFPKKVEVVQTTVPDLKGLPEADARANAQAAKLALIVSSREPSGDAKPGSVVRQSIPAGQRVPHDHPVTVVLADELPKVPVVTGLKLAEAKALLEKQGYALKVKGDLPDGGGADATISAQEPASEKGLEKGGTVTVELQAQAAAEVDVPKLAGLSVKKAQEAVEKLGLKLEVRWVAMAETATFVVLNQKPPVGKKLKAGETVEVTVNR
ncbi:MAG TPA: PASTA domain-containing protein [Polyangiaceae bacterium]